MAMERPGAGSQARRVSKMRAIERGLAFLLGIGITSHLYVATRMMDSPGYHPSAEMIRRKTSLSRSRKLLNQGGSILHDEPLSGYVNEGFATCVTDATSLVHALALAHAVSPSRKDKSSLQLEIHYDPSRFGMSILMKHEILSQPHVALKALRSQEEQEQPPDDSSSSCQGQARQSTNLGRALWIQDPSIVFLQDPASIFQAVWRASSSSTWLTLESLKTSHYETPVTWMYDSHVFPGETAWAYPKSNSLSWISHHLSFRHMDDKGTTRGADASSQAYLKIVQNYWRKYLLPLLPLVAMDSAIPMIPKEQVFREEVEALVETTMTEHLNNQKDKDLRISQWGVASSFDRNSRKTSWFLNDRKVIEREASNELSGEVNVHFNGVSKIMTAMLLYRLQELNILNLDDPVPQPNNLRSGATWRRILTGTANQGGVFTDNTASWGNLLENAVVQATGGIPFVDAFQTYIGEPMGLVGHFHTETQVENALPFTAWGYSGPMKDLLLLGSTLSGGGTSPKTHRQVLSLESTEDLLALRVPVNDAALGPSILKSPLAMALEDSKMPDTTTKLINFLKGYGSGVWRFEGVRHQPTHINAWAEIGQTMLYFDETGLVVAAHMYTASESPYDWVELFAKVVRDVGDLMASNAAEEFKTTYREA